MTQLLLTLRFYASGSFLIVMGDFMSVSKSLASRIIKRVSEAIVTLLPQNINMCQNHDEMGRMADEFYELNWHIKKKFKMIGQ